MMQAHEVAINAMELGAKLIGYVALIISIPIGLKYALADLRRDHKHATEQIGIIGEKVDVIQSTLSEMQINAARHDQRAADIQDRVKSIEGRVTYLEQRRD